jgi:hypothetical protein
MNPPIIESGIPVPKLRHRTPRAVWNNALRAMKPNQSFKVDSDMKRIAVLKAAKHLSMQVVTRKLDGEGYRIWRIK